MTLYDILYYVIGFFVILGVTCAAVAAVAIMAAATGKFVAYVLDRMGL